MDQYQLSLCLFVGFVSFLLNLGLSYADIF